MADATRSQLVLQEVEARMGEIQAEAEQKHTEVKEELTQLSQQIVELLRHNNANPQRGNYQAPTRFTKMDLPRFTSGDVVGWVSKCESYFDLDKMSKEHKVTMASLVLDEAGYRWYDGFRASSQDLISWLDFAEGIRIRFHTTIQREEVVQLKQKGSLSDYQERFGKIAYKSKLTEEQKLDCYLGGLKDELAWDVQLFNPRMVLEATRLAKIKEMSLRSGNKAGVTGSEFKKGIMSSSRVQEQHQDQKGILGKPSYRFQTEMSPAELEEHRAKNLCFWCHERFTPGHTCPQRQKSQVFFMEVLETSDTHEKVSTIKVEEDTIVVEPQVTLSLNAVIGEGSEGGSTMRVLGTMGGRTLHILFDTGSSHNFLSNTFSKVAAMEVAEIQPLQISVANGEKVEGTRVIRDFAWSMGGQHFSTEVILFPLEGCDMILGM